jgi:hypothetical protein
MATDQELFDRCVYALLSGGRAPTIERAGRLSTRTANLLRDLQNVECKAPPDAWAVELRRLAAAYNLTMPE